MLALDDGWLRPPPTRDQQRTDLLVGLGLTVLSLLMVELLRSTPAVEDFGDRTTEAFLWGAAAVLPLVVRRRFPITTMLLCSLAFYGAGERVTPVTA